jgi:myo-inositol-1(or 4)-monophosphatase
VEFLDFATDLARQAGDILNHYTAREKQVEFKGLANLVTIADKESEALIIRSIRERYPNHSILAEESGSADFANADRGSKWLIDPVDGTTNFAHRYPFYSVSIALEQLGEIVCGVVYDPHRDEMFTATNGGGAYLNGERLRVSDVGELSHSLLTTGFPYNFRHRIDVVMGQFREFLVASQAVRRGGSAALDLCYVAMGRCDGFWELDLQPWDTAAGRVILEEAGGRITDFGGNSFSIYGKQILASNGRIHEEMERVLKR